MAKTLQLLIKFIESVESRRAGVGKSGIPESFSQCGNSWLCCSHVCGQTVVRSKALTSATWRDVKWRRAVEMALRRSRKRLRPAFKSSPGAPSRLSFARRSSDTKQMSYPAREAAAPNSAGLQSRTHKAPLKIVHF